MKFNLKKEREKLFKKFIEDKGIFDFNNHERLWDKSTQLAIKKLIIEHDKKFIEILKDKVEHMDYNYGDAGQTARRIVIELGGYGR